MGCALHHHDTIRIIISLVIPTFKLIDHYQHRSAASYIAMCVRYLSEWLLYTEL